MAISPPSDLVLDVVRAADPADVSQAQARLQSNRAAFRASSLAENGAGFTSAVSVLNQGQGTTGLGNINNRTESQKVPETYTKFEAMVLQNFVKSMLPAESEGVYGKGNTGEIWKSMMAEQIGTVIAKSGGIGIAESLMGPDRTAPIDDVSRVNPSVDGNSLNVASSMVYEYERKAVSELWADDSNAASR